MREGGKRYLLGGRGESHKLMAESVTRAAGAVRATALGRGDRHPLGKDIPAEGRPMGRGLF